VTTQPLDVDTTVLISAAGYARLESELELLRTDARRALSERLREAREDGDLDDNPALGDLLEEQGQLEQRISLLEARVRSAEIVEPSADGRAGIGTLVRVRDFAAGSTHEYELVGHSSRTSEAAACPSRRRSVERSSGAVPGTGSTSRPRGASSGSSCSK